MLDMNKIKKLDNHWKEVMDLATKYGFVCQEAGGTAILLTHRNCHFEGGMKNVRGKQRRRQAG